jgi:hypothetical protein
MRIYIASSWKNPIQPQIVKLLRERGYEVYDFRNPTGNSNGFHWSEINKHWQEWDAEQYREALNHPAANSGFSLDFNAMKWADCCIMVLPCGRSASVEAGWMKGVGKKVIVFQIDNSEPELMYKLFDKILISFDELSEEFPNLVSTVI